MRNMSNRNGDNGANFKKVEESFFEAVRLYAEAVVTCGVCDREGTSQATAERVKALCQHIERLFDNAKAAYFQEIKSVILEGTVSQVVRLGCYVCTPVQENLGFIIDENTLGMLADLFDVVKSVPQEFFEVRNFKELYECYIAQKRFDNILRSAYQHMEQNMQVSEEESERTRASIWKKLQESRVFQFETPENTAKTVKVEVEIPSKGFTLSREYPVDASGNPVVEDTPRNDGALFVGTKDDETSVKVSTPLFDVEVHCANNDGNNYRLNDVYPLQTMDVPVKGNAAPKASGVFATPAKDFPIEAVLARRDGAYYPVGMFATFTADFFTK